MGNFVGKCIGCSSSNDTEKKDDNYIDEKFQGIPE